MLKFLYFLLSLLALRVNLESIVLSKNINELCDAVFHGCTKLKSITIPECVITSGNNMFGWCTNLSSIKFEGNVPELFDTEWAEVFNGITATVYYPANNDTWTEEVRNEFGGELAWVAYTDCEENGGHVDEDTNNICDNCGTENVSDFFEKAPLLTADSKTVYNGSEFTVDLYLSNAAPATSLALIDITVGSEYVEIIDVEWLLPDTEITDVNLDEQKAAIAFDEAVDMNGAVMRLYLKAQDVPQNTSCEISCSATIEINNVRIEVGSISGTIQILDYIRGDTNDDSIITSADAIYLLRYTLLPERYPLSGGDADYNGDGTVNADDAVYLLYHVMIPERFPIES